MIKKIRAGDPIMEPGNLDGAIVRNRSSLKREHYRFAKNIPEDLTTMRYPGKCRVSIDPKRRN